MKKRIMKVRLIFGSMTYLIYFLLYMSISQNVKASLDTRLEILPVFSKGTVFLKEPCFKGTGVFKGTSVFKVTGSNDDVMRRFYDSLRRFRCSPQAKSYVLIFFLN